MSGMYSDIANTSLDWTWSFRDTLHPTSGTPGINIWRPSCRVGLPITRLTKSCPVLTSSLSTETGEHLRLCYSLTFRKSKLLNVNTCLFWNMSAGESELHVKYEMALGAALINSQILAVKAVSWSLESGWSQVIFSIDIFSQCIHGPQIHGNKW